MTGNRTPIAGMTSETANHYTMGPVMKLQLEFVKYLFPVILKNYRRHKFSVFLGGKCHKKPEMAYKT